MLLTQTNKNNLLYTAIEFDFDTGLQFNRERYYSVSLGRFNYKDKVFYLNYFIYFSNDPLNYYDPLGLAICHCFIYQFTGAPCAHNTILADLFCPFPPEA